MLKKSCCLLLHQLRNHIAQDRSHSIESLICGADVVQSMIIEENLLDDEDGHCFAELRTGFHYSKAQRNDFCGQQEVDDIRRIVFDKSPDDAEGCKTQVLKGSRFRGGIEEWVQEKWDVCWNN